ncbi:MAG: DegT/DnrJ/EryC1/StrS family aminotransferase [Clostridia bacterium]|nr:DegT/DnrJ/EryC1/StrS family aminotransferase [Clostridia bacterium]
MSKLAINGGTPVRETLLNGGFPGAMVYGEEEAKAVYEVCMAQSPFRYYGPNVLGKVDQFEEAFAKRMGVKHVLGVTSCTAGLVVALKAAGIGPGHKVIVPACTFLATAGAVICAGAVPVFADVDDTQNIDPKAIGGLVDQYTKAVIAVPLLGSPCQMDEVVKEAKKYNLIVIEDVAQSMGSSLNGKPMGTWGDIGVYSMQMNKILTTGEGGVVVTNNDELYERAVRYHDQGQYRKVEGRLTNNPDRVFVGQNYRMSELTGAVACVQLSKLDDIIAKMKRNKAILKNELKDVPGLTFRRIIDDEGDAASSLMMFVESKEKSDAFCQAMWAENVAFNSLYGGRPVYMIPQIFYKKTADANGFPFNQFDEEIVYTEDMCPNAISVMPRNVFTYIDPTFTEKDLEDIVTAVKKVAAEIL